MSRSQDDFRAMLFASKLKAAPLARENLQQHKLFVGGLSWNTTNETLEKAFAAHGKVTDARVVMEHDDTTRSRGFGFVSFATAEEMASALAAMDGAELDGRPIGVSASTPSNPPSVKRAGPALGGGAGAQGGLAQKWPVGGTQQQPKRVAAQTFEEAMKKAGGDAGKSVGDPCDRV